MVQDVVATLDGQSGGCALIGSYTSLHTRVHHKGGDRGSFTYSWYFLGLMFVCMCVSRILWCVQLSNGSMLLIVQMCANMYCMCVEGECISAQTFHVQYKFISRNPVCVHGQLPWKWVNAHDFVWTCRRVHVGKHACECTELCRPLFCCLKRQLLFCVCLRSPVTSRRCFVVGSFLGLIRDKSRLSSCFKWMIIHC